MVLSDAVQIAVVTTAGTVVVALGQTLIQEWMRGRKLPAAHDDIADRVADRIGASPSGRPRTESGVQPTDASKESPPKEPSPKEPS